MIQTVHHGKRTKEEAEAFVQTMQQNRDGEAPLFLSDGWPSYPDVFANASSHEDPVPYAGRGRPPHPIRVIDPNLKYAQVIKHTKNGRLIESEQRVIGGTEEERRAMRRDGKRGQGIQTRSVESRHGNYRKDTKR